MWSGTFVGGESAANLDPQWSKAGVCGCESYAASGLKEVTRNTRPKHWSCQGAEKQNKTFSEELRLRRGSDS